MEAAIVLRDTKRTFCGRELEMNPVEAALVAFEDWGASGVNVGVFGFKLVIALVIVKLINIFGLTLEVFSFLFLTLEPVEIPRRVPKAKMEATVVLIVIQHNFCGRELEKNPVGAALGNSKDDGSNSLLFDQLFVIVLCTLQVSHRPISFLTSTEIPGCLP